MTTPGLATLDLVISGLLLLFAVAGAMSGALRQLVQLGAVVAGWLAARDLAPRLAGPLLGSRPAAWERGALAVACFVGAVVLAGMVGRAVARRLHGPSGTPGLQDRSAGALLALVKVGLAIWVLLSAAALARGPLVLGPLRLDPAASRFGALAIRFNLLEVAAPRQARALERLLQALRDPAARERLLQGDPRLQRLLDDPRVKALLEQKAGVRPPTPEQERAILSDPELKALVERLEPE